MKKQWIQMVCVFLRLCFSLLRWFYFINLIIQTIVQIFFHKIFLKFLRYYNNYYTKFYKIIIKIIIVFFWIINKDLLIINSAFLDLNRLFFLKNILSVKIEEIILFLAEPPSYDSLFGRIRDTHKASRNVIDFLIKVNKIRNKILIVSWCKNI